MSFSIDGGFLLVVTPVFWSLLGQDETDIKYVRFLLLSAVKTEVR